MIWTDGVHLISDNGLEELHEYAAEAGIKRCHFHRGRWPHYDIPKYLRSQFEAEKIDIRTLIRILRRRDEQEK